MAERERPDNPGIERLHLLDRRIAVVVGEVLPPLMGIYAEDIRVAIEKALQADTDEPVPGWRRIRAFVWEEEVRLRADWAIYCPTAMSVARVVSGGKLNPEHVHIFLANVDAYTAVVLDVGVGRLALGVKEGWKFFDRGGKVVDTSWKDGSSTAIDAMLLLATAFDLPHAALAGIEKALYSWRVDKRNAIVESRVGVFRVAKELTDAVLDSPTDPGDVIHSRRSAEQGVSFERGADQPLVEAVVGLLWQLDLARFENLKKEALMGSSVLVGQDAETDPGVILSNKSEARVAVAIIRDGRWLRVSSGEDGVRDYELDSTQRIEAVAKWVGACRGFVEKARAPKAP